MAKTSLPEQPNAFRTDDQVEDWLAALPDGPTLGASERKELVIERKTGRVRQAGAATAEGAYVIQRRTRCERDLYYFLRTIWNMWWLWPPLHVPVCKWLQTVPPRAKALVMPRGCGKSTIVAQGIPPHMLIQPKESNVYIAGLAGCDTRILMVGENEKRISDHYRPIRQAFENNDLLRGLWPHLFWDNPRKDSPKWNESELIIQRGDNYPDPSIRAIGVGGATTGSHPVVMIKDDLTTDIAANEPPTMQKAIKWHDDSRALFASRETGLEFITGTRWAVMDLIGHILENDPTVEVNTKWRQIVEDDAVLYPPGFGKDPATVVDQLRMQHGDVMFHLLYMNSVLASGLTDFDPQDLRSFAVDGANFTYEDKDADERLEQELGAIVLPQVVPDLRGLPLSQAMGLSQDRWKYLRKVRSA
jgi:hypothetical protein